MTLTEALALAVTRLVGASKVGTRRGSTAAVVHAMNDIGCKLSPSQMGRKMAGVYPFDTDEIQALATVLEIDPDDIWAEAMHIRRTAVMANPAELAATADAIVSTFTPEAQESIRRAQEDLRPKRDEGEEPGASTGA